MKMKALLPVLLLATSAANAALTNTITVTTLLDENGTGSACSLREAVQAVINRAAFGGCPAGSRTATNVIQLDHGSYALTLGEIVVPAAVTIAGKDSNKPDDVNPYTNAKPVRLRPDDAANGTWIVGKSGSRLFFSSADLTLRDVVLQAAGQVPATDNLGNGGVIYAAASLALDNVQVLGGNATGDGGGIFVTGNEAALTLSNTQIVGNVAAGKGGAAAFQCAPGYVTYPTHMVTISSSYFSANSSTTGAGVLQLCGDSSAAVSVSTFSGNSSAAGFGAITYQMPTGAPMGVLGSVTFSAVTAVANTGYGLALNGIAIAAFSSSVIAFNSAGDCLVGADAITTKSGTFSATQDLATTGCSALFGTATSNVIIPAATSMAGEFSATADYHGGLTKNYLPATGSAYIRDKGDLINTCAQADQRGIGRRSGANCDIGAVERLVLTANDDTITSNVDREAWVDVLANDAFGETDTKPNHWDETKFVVDIVQPTNAKGKCEWDNDKRQMHVFTVTGGVADGGVTPENDPIICTYKVRDVDDGATTPNGYSAVATLEVNIGNAAPIAVADVVVRPVGQSSISFNPLSNDNDKGDGENQPANWATYPIYIASNPSLGVLDLAASASGHCPDWTATNQKICYQPPLKYIASNNLSPFTDSFTYIAYDSDNKASAATTVTLKTDAPDPDKGETGSLDLLGGLAVLLLGLRRLRRL